MYYHSLADFAKKLTEIMPLIVRGFLKRQSDEVTRGKISIPQFLTLELIYANGSMKMTRLAKGLAISLPSMTGLVDRLYKMGLVKRRPDEHDRRIIKIELTQKGKDVVGKILKQRLEFISEIFGKINEAERAQYLRILTKIKEILYETEVPKKGS